MTAYAILPLICAILLLSLGAFVFFQKRKTSERILLSFLCFEAFYWQIVWFISFLSKNPSDIDYLAKISYVTINFLPFTFYHFIAVYLKLKSENKFIVAFYLVGLFLTFLLPTNLFVIGHRHFSWGNFAAPGTLYPVYMMAALIAMTRGLYILIKAYKTPLVYGRTKNQIRYIFTGLFLYYSCAIDFLSVYGANWYPLGSFSFLGSFAVITYAIVRHQLMDIEVIIKKTLVFAGLFGMVMAVVAAVTTITQSYLGQYLKLNPAFSTTLGVMIAMLFYDPTRQFLVHLTDRFLFQKKFRLTTIVAQASQAISLIQSLKWLSKRIVAFLVTLCRIKNAAVYTRNKNSEDFLRGAVRGYALGNYPPEFLPAYHTLIQYLEKTRTALELHRFEGHPIEISAREEQEKIIDVFKYLKAELIVPSFLRRRAETNIPGDEEVENRGEVELRNILVLGGKKSDEPYSDEELEVFSSLAQESAIAIENARLYDEAVHRSMELAATNEELSDTNKRLKEAQAALMEEKKRALLAGISSAVGHEIRSPISSQATNLYFCEKRVKEIAGIYDSIAPNLPKKEKEKFSNAVKSLGEYHFKLGKSLDRIKGIVNTLLNLVKNRSEQKSQVQLKLLFASALEEVRFQTYWETLAEPLVERDIPPDLPFVSGITQDLQGVFVNLIINALHAMEKKADKKIAVKARIDEKNPEMVRIEFSDNGYGIPQEIQDKIFEHGFTTKGEKGTGIGLFYCKDNIERVHEGTFEVKSESGTGTCFIIRLPIYKESQKAHH